MEWRAKMEIEFIYLIAKKRETASTKFNVPLKRKIQKKSSFLGTTWGITKYLLKFHLEIHATLVFTTAWKERGEEEENRPHIKCYISRETKEIQNECSSRDNNQMPKKINLAANNGESLLKGGMEKRNRNLTLTWKSIKWKKKSIYPKMAMR